MKKLNVEEVKRIEIEILDVFVDICKKNNLRYYLVAGTLIGAVRHNGFIPWDDDIDVGMPRNDYEKFKNLLLGKTYLSKYKLLAYEDGTSKYNFMKLVDDTTLLKEKYMQDDIGVWIDIFPIDGMPDSYNKNRKLCNKLDFWRRLLNLTNARSDVGKSKSRKIFKSIVVPIVKAIPTSYLCKKINNIFARYSFDDSEYVGAVSGGVSIKGRVKKEVYDTCELLFEGKLYVAPKGYDILLSQSYGNYMQLPPENERVSHEFEAFIK